MLAALYFSFPSFQLLVFWTTTSHLLPSSSSLLRSISQQHLSSSSVNATALHRHSVPAKPFLSCLTEQFVGVITLPISHSRNVWFEFLEGHWIKYEKTLWFFWFLPINARLIQARFLPNFTHYYPTTGLWISNSLTVSYYFSAQRFFNCISN
jgi:hypothetical protein